MKVWTDEVTAMIGERLCHARDIACDKEIARNILLLALTAK